ncbi:MAG: HD domain-containing protein [Candidatus Hydrothermarchaeales archaeon]
MVGNKSVSAYKVIRDSVHGDIFLTELELEIVDTPEFQRLRRIRQLGMTHLVYPGANHTRFEHSLGALHLAGRIAGNLELDKEDERRIRVSALLHDIGHGPLSHTSEELLERYLGHSHEEITKDIIANSQIGQILESEGVDIGLVGRIITGEEKPLGEIVSGEFDVDRMDFLVRDAHYTGVAYGIVDLDRLINTIEISNGSLVITERGLRAVEALLVARFLMTPTVYFHHASRVADAMFLRATEKAIEDGVLDYNELYEMDDYDIQNLFNNSSGYVHDIGGMFAQRRLFKKAALLFRNDLDEGVVETLVMLRNNLTKWRRIEAEMAEDCNVASGYIILDIPPMPEYREGEVFISRDGETLKLEDASPLAGILREAHKNQWSVGIYTPKENLDKVSKACRELERYSR